MRPHLGIVALVVGIAAGPLLAACSSSSPSVLGGGTTTSAATTSAPSTSASTSPSATSATATLPVASTTTATAAAGNFDSCAVVTQAEASSAIGEQVTPGILGTATVEGGLACVFYGPSAPTPHLPNVAQPDSVRVVVVQGVDALAWYNNYESKVNAQPISGYGVRAFYDGAASLSVLKGRYYLRVAVRPAGAVPSLPDEEQLARAILPSL